MPIRPQWNDVFKYSTHQRKRQCVICNTFVNENTLKSINANRALLLYQQKHILLHPAADKLCSVGANNCNTKTLEQLLQTPDDILYENISESSIKDDRTKRIVQNMAALFSSKFFDILLKDKFYPRQERIFSFENNSEEGTEILCNRSPTKIKSVSEYIIKNVKKSGLRLTAVIDQCDKNKKNDDTLVPVDIVNENKEDEDKNDEENEIEVTESEINRVGNCIYIFLIKSKTKISNKILGVYHQYTKEWIGKLFHRGRFLIWTFLAPFHIGAGHLTRAQLLSKQSNWSRLINELTGRTMILLADGMKIRQHRFHGHYG
eukprot:144769_1